MSNQRNIENAILVWRFGDAPECYRELSQNGGDEDWLAFVPDALAKDYIAWMEASAFGTCCVEEHEVTGGVIRIGSHA